MHATSVDRKGRVGRALVAALVVALVVLSLPGRAGAQIEDQIPALIDFSSAWTNDDGQVDGADVADIGETDAIYDLWGDASSVDPSGPGVAVSRYDKDVAKCIADLNLADSPDQVNVEINNSYPSYHCTIVATVSNTSAFPATVEMLTVDVDDGLTVTQDSSVNPGVVIGPGAAATVEFTVHVEQEAPQSETLHFWITYVVGGDVIDLELDIQCAAGDGIVTFTFDIENKGPENATGVAIKEQLPNLPIVSSSASAGTFNPGNTWTVGALAANTSATLTVVMATDLAVPANATAEVSTANEVDVDSIPGNGVATEDDHGPGATCTAVQVLAAAVDLSLVKTVDRTQVQKGETVTFTLTVTNSSFTLAGLEPVSASGVEVTDVLPAGTTFVSASTAAGTTFDPATGTWDIGGIPLGESRVMSVTVTLDDADRQYVNSAEVTLAAPNDIDSTPNNHVPTEDDQDTALVSTEALPRTGEDVDRLSSVGAAAFLLGSLLLLLTRRRRSAIDARQ